MKRRTLAAIAINAVAGSFAARAQRNNKVHRIGWLGVDSWVNLPGFREEMSRRGYELWTHYVVNPRTPGADIDQSMMEFLATELAGLQTDVLVAEGGNESVAAAIKATKTIPIVMAGVSDPVVDGLVASWKSPGGNVTGIATMEEASSAKRIQLLIEGVGKPVRIGYFIPRIIRQRPSEIKAIASMEAAAKDAGAGFEVIEGDPDAGSKLDKEFEQIADRRVNALVVRTRSTYWQPLVHLGELTVQHRLPAIGGWADFPEGGGLMSFGVNPTYLGSAVAHYVDRILNGAKPADMPIDQVSRFEFVLNLKTAKMLRLNLPRSLVARADRLIQ